MPRACRFAWLKCRHGPATIAPRADLHRDSASGLRMHGARYAATRAHECQPVARTFSPAPRTHPLARHRRTARGNKQRIAALFADDGLPPLLQITLQPDPCFFAKRHQPRLVAFAGNAQYAFVHPQFNRFQQHQFRYAQTSWRTLAPASCGRAGRLMCQHQALPARIDLRFRKRFWGNGAAALLILFSGRDRHGSGFVARQAGKTASAPTTADWQSWLSTQDALQQNTHSDRF